MTYRTTAQFNADKSKGQKAEKTFMELIALMGGTAYYIGKVPGQFDEAPRFSRPHPVAEEGFCYSVAPDIAFSLPDRPRGFSCLAQVKVKKVGYENGQAKQHILLDEKELHRMRVAHQFYDVFFVIHLPQFSEFPDQIDWAWIGVEELLNTNLVKRQIQNKPTFLIPFHLFKPLSQLNRWIPNEPANSNTAPTS